MPEHQTVTTTPDARGIKWPPMGSLTWPRSPAHSARSRPGATARTRERRRDRHFSAGVMDRLGLGYQQLRAERADPIVVHMTGLGSVGPHSHCVTFGPSLDGVLRPQAAVEPSRHASSRRLAVVLARLPSRHLRAYAILAALHQRRRTGQGALLDRSQALITATAIGPSIVRLSSDNVSATAIDNASRENAPHGCYPCRGGTDDWCVISVMSAEQWTGLVRALGTPEWTSAERYASAEGRLARADELDERIARWTRTLTRHQRPTAAVRRGRTRRNRRNRRGSAQRSQLIARGFFARGDPSRLGSLCLPGSAVWFRHTEVGV